jgi:imidazolonepropionase-like amidohydrolase
VPDAAVVVTDGIITYAGAAIGLPPQDPHIRTIDAAGGSILPGLIEAHIHLTYFNVTELQDLDIKYPVEYVTLQSAVNAKTALECGYTAARSGGCLHNIDVWMKKAIEEDMIPGPRLSASGREICGAGGLMDWNPDYRRIGMEGLVLLVNGPDEARAAVRKLVKDGVEWVKTYPNCVKATHRDSTPYLNMIMELTGRGMDLEKEESNINAIIKKIAEKVVINKSFKATDICVDTVEFCPMDECSQDDCDGDDDDNDIA